MTVRYREEPGWEAELRAQALPEMVERAHVVAAHVDGIQEGRFMARRGRRAVDVVVVRGEARVRNTKAGWHLQEFGSVNSVVQGPLRRGTIAAGLAFAPHPPPA